MSESENSRTPPRRSLLRYASSDTTKSGVYALPDGREAFAARVLLADAAEQAIDAQYYIWNGDMSGTLLFDALRRAADRGVRVRLLLDDIGTTGIDSLLAALNAHHNIEVRLFSPVRLQSWRALGYLTHFARLNHRMHNKSFLSDGQAAIVGGRNVGDEYFGAGRQMSFVDLDVLATGPVVNEVACAFDRYWASASAVPAERVLPAIAPADISCIAAAALRVVRDPASLAYTEATTTSPFARMLRARQLPLEWATTYMLSDDPAKALGLAVDQELLWPRLKHLLGLPTKELQLVSAYFVSGEKGVRFFSVLAEQGVKVEVLTNSLEATDVPAVHAGYAKWRTSLLHAGVTLFEIKRDFSPPPVRGRGPVGSSRASLHAKTFSVDRQRVFVGSFNFDPRSARLNTEMGFVIDSPGIAQQIADAFSGDVPARAYKMRLSDASDLQWVERRGDGELVHTREPGASIWRRAAVSVLSRLPIERLL